MKLPLIVALSLSSTPLSLSGEVLETLRTRAGREYSKVEVLTNDDVGIRIRHDGGMARIAYGDLPDSIQSKYRDERKKAAVAKIEATKAEQERLKQEQEKNEQEQLEEKTKKPAKPKSESKTPKPTVTGEIETATNGQEVQKLSIYIEEMKAKSTEATVEAARLRREAEMERSRTRTVSKRNSYTGQNTYEVVPDKAGRAKAAKYEEQAEALQRQVDNARSLILDAKARQNELREGP